MSLRCRSDVRADAVILTLTGVLDGAGRLPEAAGGLLRRSRRPLVIDLSGLWAWTGAGQQALGATVRESMARGMAVAVCGLPDHLAVTDPRLAVLPFQNTLASALWSLRAGTGGDRRGPGLPRAALPVSDGVRALRHARCVFPAGRESVSLAREWAKATVTGWGLPLAAARIGLPLREIVTHALLYGRATGVRVTVGIWPTPAGRRLLVSVDDANPHAPVTAPESAVADISAEPGGLDLRLLRATTAGHGWHPAATGGGKTLWFALEPGAARNVATKPTA